MNTRTFRKVLDARFHATRRTIAAIPSDNLDFRPAPGMMTVRELALHIVGNYTFLNAGLLKNVWDPATFRFPGEYPTSDAIVSKLDSVYEESREALSRVPDEAFERRVSPFGTEQKTSSLLLGIAEHEIQHRGQLQVYLRLMGVTPPAVFGE